MCGIAGILTRDPSRYEPAALRMRAAMAHRGPDDSGLAAIEANHDHCSLLLAHRRLSIIDLSPAGHQPMHDPETGNWIVFNGEIYNFRQLRADLESLGHSFCSDCDTEVILKGYAAWGRQVLTRLRGMFAFAIYDHSRRQLLLARDRVGIKPLYYARHPRPDVTLLFASEIRALLASDLVPRRPSHAGVASYLINGCVIDPWTIVENVVSLLPAHYLVVDMTGTVVDQGAYWRLPAEQGQPQPRPAETSRIRGILEDAVRTHMISDVPLGAFLSGGVDSSTLVALMQSISSAPVRTFSLVFDDPQLNEARYSRSVAATLRTQHQEVHVTEQDFLDLLDDALTAIDQPTTDAINSYVVSRKCKESGLTVAIAGTGGDELFGGYSSFTRVPRAMRLLRCLSRLPGSCRSLLTQMARLTLTDGSGPMPSTGLSGKLTTLLGLPDDDLRVYQLHRAVLLPEICDRLLGGPREASRTWGLASDWEKVLREATGAAKDPRRQVSVCELCYYLSNQLLRDTDAVSMAVSLEVRVPFLDHELIGAVFDVAPDQLYAGPRSKQLLIDAVQDILPPQAYEHPKQGFVLPIGRWLTGPLHRTVKETLTDARAVASLGLDPHQARLVMEDCQAAGQKIFYTRLWSLFVLVDWCRRHQLSL
jgi:asparagine synthase (glutamine-hydrolysing)